VSSSTPGKPLTDFGANEWLVNEMYERYRENPASVSSGWREFFADVGGQEGDAGTPSAPPPGGRPGPPPPPRPHAPGPTARS
jgi:multifunctional 2-oxoglutarate metabolism enzyme